LWNEELPIAPFFYAFILPAKKDQESISNPFFNQSRLFLFDAC